MTNELEWIKLQFDISQSVLMTMTSETNDVVHTAKMSEYEWPIDAARKKQLTS